MSDVAVYIQDKYYAQQRYFLAYESRSWPGMALIKDALTRGGVKVGYTGAATVTDYKIILLSITSPIDWFSFIAERVNWPKGDYRVIVGGAGNLNVRPVLEYADIFVLGRAESFVVDLVNQTLAGDRFEHESVIYADSFDMQTDYRIAQADSVYPHEITLADGKPWKETASGCQKKCLFCGYTWQRRNIGGNQHDAGASDSIWFASGEYTLFDIDLESDPADWFEFSEVRIIVGIDGLTEKLRFAANKQITDERFRRFIKGMCKRRETMPVQAVKLYNICGYPGETESDWFEFANNFVKWDSPGIREGNAGLGIEVHMTPFDPMPATPAAVWPVQLVNYRNWIEDGRFKFAPYPQKYSFYQGVDYHASFTSGTPGLASVMLWVLMVRATERDAENIRRLVLTKKFWNASQKIKYETLRAHFDVDKLAGAWTWETLPTRNIVSYIPNSGMAKLSDRSRFINLD